MQYQRLGGATFSTVHKPCKECGTGYRVSEERADLNIINAESALCFAPHWAKYSETKAIVKYKDIADFMKGSFHKDCKIIEPIMKKIQVSQQTFEEILSSGHGVPRTATRYVQTGFSVGKEYEIFPPEKDKSLKVICTQDWPTHLKVIGD